MPSDRELKEYAARLPRIYRDILTAFPAVDPSRKSGYGLALQTIVAHFANRGMEHRWDDVQTACRRLADMGFLEIRNGIFAHPSELGERLIATITGKSAADVDLPELPAPTW